MSCQRTDFRIGLASCGNNSPGTTITVNGGVGTIRLGKLSVVLGSSVVRATKLERIGLMANSLVKLTILPEKGAKADHRHEHSIGPTKPAPNPFCSCQVTIFVCGGYKRLPTSAKPVVACRFPLSSWLVVSSSFKLQVYFFL